MRGLAALAVCWFHITITSANFNDGLLKSSGQYGWLGVEVFFVISGFIIPYALYNTNYTLRNYPTFLLKRIIRLDPPYLMSIVLVLLVSYAFTLTPHSTQNFQVQPAGLILHLAYLNVFFHYPWLNPVYWTLAIEFQYYILIGLLFVLISSKRRIVRIATFVLLGSTAAFIHSSDFIFSFIFLFLMGMSVFQFKEHIAARWEFALLLSAAAAGAYFSLGFVFMLAGLVGVSGILFLSARNSILNFLGRISYSLYLVHPPAVRLVMGVGRRFATNQPARILLASMSMSLSIGTAYFFFRFIEKPAQRWSSALSYQSKPEAVRLPETIETMPEPAL